MQLAQLDHDERMISQQLAQVLSISDRPSVAPVHEMALPQSVAQPHVSFNSIPAPAPQPQASTVSVSSLPPSSPNPKIQSPTELSLSAQQPLHARSEQASQPSQPEVRHATMSAPQTAPQPASTAPNSAAVAQVVVQPVSTGQQMPAMHQTPTLQPTHAMPQTVAVQLTPTTQSSQQASVPANAQWSTDAVRWYIWCD
jgi:hypothetical protein